MYNKSNLIVSLNAPIVFEFKNTNANKIMFLVKNQKGQTIATLTKYVHKKYVAFDIANILKTMLNDLQSPLPLLQDVQPLTERLPFEDGRNAVAFKVGYKTDDNAAAHNKNTFFAINSLPNNRIQNYRTGIIAGEYLTQSDLIKYQDFPLCVTYMSFSQPNRQTVTKYRFANQIDYSIINVCPPIELLQLPTGTIADKLNNNLIIQGTTNKQNLPYYEGIFNIPIPDDATESIFVGHNNGIKTITKIDCKIKNPYYLRWIGWRGGWEHFMFFHNQTTEIKKENQEILQTYEPRTYNLKQLATQPNITKTITIGAENLTKRQTELLKCLLFASYVEHYDTTTKQWQRVFIDNQSLKTSNVNQRYKIELNVRL